MDEESVIRIGKGPAQYQIVSSARDDSNKGAAQGARNP